MPQSYFWMAFFFVLALVIVIAIFAGAMRWVNSVKGKNVRFKWITREVNRPK